MIVKMIVKAINKDTTSLNEHVKMTTQHVKCNSCGAEYQIDTYSDKPPTVSKEMLMRLDNSPHP